MKRLQLVLSLWLAACAGERTELTCFVAASFDAAAHEAAREYARVDPGTVIAISSGGSQVLARQIEAGAPADLFVAASEAHAEAIGGRLSARQTLTCNDPVLVVADGVPVRSLRDLPRAERIVLGTPEVPIGAYSEQILERGNRVFDQRFADRVRARVVSRELDVRQVMSKVVLGEADAAIVYRTDAIAAGVRAIPIDRAIAPRARYPIALVQGSAHREAARAFADWLRGPRGREILEAHGFVRCDR